MTILECHRLTKEFNGQPILSEVSFRLDSREKMAIVGINGAGKTTLLRLILGELEPDDGAAIFARDVSVGYLAQNQDVDGDKTIYEELLSAKKDLIDIRERMDALEADMGQLFGAELNQAIEEHQRLSDSFKRDNGFGLEGDVLGVARGLGFKDDELSKEISILSGGQKTRVALGKLLLQKRDLIILDEPTNHLDVSAIEWLEGYLRNYRGAVIIVSHDRYFLDRIVTKVAEVSLGKVSVWEGNYSDYAKNRAKDREAKLKAYLNQQKQIQRQEAVIEKLKSFNREKSIKRAESREKMLSKIEVIEKPTEERADMHLRLTPQTESAEDVLSVSSLAKGFGGKSLFSDLSFELKRGEHVAIIGSNGTGKTTLLRIINGLLLPDKGRVTLGVRVKTAYYDQEHHVLTDSNTLFDEISDAHPDMNNTEIRTKLAAFLFTGDDVFKTVGQLSGGEKGRLSLLKLMLSKANFLLLDEPTNHLDITSKEILEEAIRNYSGTVLYVSHDRYFINKTATRILDLSDKRIVNYIGDYDYYLSHRDTRLDLQAKEQGKNEQTKEAPNQASGKENWAKQKELQKEQRRKENELKKCEESINELEERIKAIDEELSLPENGYDLAKLRKLSDEREESQNKLDELYEKWEELSI